MKQTFKIIMLIVAIMTTAQTYAADNRQERISREELAKTQAKHIAKQLAFDEATTGKFVDTYCRCQQEIWTIDSCPETDRKKKRRAECKSGMSIEKRLERSQKLLDIRKKYYGEYSKFLTDAQIDRVYQIEKKMMDRLGKHRKGRNRKPRR